MMERRSSTPPTTTLTHKAVDKHWLFAKALTASQVVAIDKFHFFFSFSFLWRSNCVYNSICGILICFCCYFGRTVSRLLSRRVFRWIPNNDNDKQQLWLNPLPLVSLSEIVATSGDYKAEWKINRSRCQRRQSKCDYLIWAMSSCLMHTIFSPQTIYSTVYSVYVSSR